jgi:hypothetical protein
VQVKQFLIQFEYNDTTRWEDDKAVALFVASVASESVRYKTDGAFPLTTVFCVKGWPGPARPGGLVALEIGEAISK